MRNVFRLYLIAAITAVLVFPVKKSTAQGVCFEIKSILVDACGSPEGENEMVRFDVGAAPLNVADLVVDWPNNNWLGLCQDATTAGIITSINNLIQGCGSVSEPVNGVLPANSKVLLLTSLNVNTILNSFANLNDNLIVLFQCNGNTSGHFANYNVIPGLRTLEVEFTGAGGCIDSVTYDRTQLINQFGIIGGFTFENDGAFVEFTTAGLPTYLNYGCQVLSTGLALSGGPDVGICPGGAGTAALNGTAVNLVGNPAWSGGTGTFNPNNALSTVYTPGAGETGIVYLSISGSGNCGTSITDTVRVNIVNSLPSVNITSTVSGMFYSNITDTTYFYNWYPDGSTTYIPGAFNPEFTPSANGCYYMILSTVGGCTVQSNTLCITNVGIAETGDGPAINMYNSPGSNPWITINTANQQEQLSVTITDAYGKLILNDKLYAAGQEYQLHPDWTGESAGIYFVRITNGTWFTEAKLLLTR
jgi:hypothetical protein